MRERVRRYELMFVISPLHSGEEEVAAIIQRLQQTIESSGGEVTNVSHTPPWGRRKLAYPIRAYAGGEASRRSFTEGFYVLLHFTISSAKMTNLEQTIKYTDAILRHLITLVETQPSLEVLATQDEEPQESEESEEDEPGYDEDQDEEDQDRE